MQHTCNTHRQYVTHTYTIYTRSRACFGGRYLVIYFPLTEEKPHSHMTGELGRGQFVLTVEVTQCAQWIGDKKTNQEALVVPSQLANSPRAGRRQTSGKGRAGALGQGRAMQ